MCKECHHATNGLEAVQMVGVSMQTSGDVESQQQSSPYDVVLIDCFMPVMSGPEAVRRMRDLGYKGLILAVTGSSHSEGQGEMRACGADKVLLKPFNLDVFRSSIAGMWYLIISQSVFYKLILDFRRSRSKRALLDSSPTRSNK
jgi:CheY-like chemotaxis protein